MPLSEHEQRLLEQMERALYAEDPKFATSMRGAELRSRYRKRAIAAAVGFLAGLTLLMTGPISGAPLSRTAILGLLGFALMLASATFAVTSWRAMPDAAEAAAARPVGSAAPKPGSKPGSKPGGRPARSKDGFMNRVEDRWRRRRDEFGR
jgi:hypothetical protein